MGLDMAEGTQARGKREQWWEGRDDEGRFSTDDREKNYEKEARGMETD